MFIPPPALAKKIHRPLIGYVCVDASSKKLIYVAEIRLSLLATAIARRCERERSAGTTLTAEGYREPQE